jgi:hypothetical protein
MFRGICPHLVRSVAALRPERNCGGYGMAFFCGSEVLKNISQAFDSPSSFDAEPKQGKIIFHGIEGIELS